MFALAELLTFLIEVFGDSILQPIQELETSVLDDLTVEIRRWSPAIAAIALAFAGLSSGLLATWLSPARLIPTRPIFPEASLIVAPLVTIGAAYGLGKYVHGLESQDCRRVALAGALFAFSMALARCWIISSMTLN